MADRSHIEWTEATWNPIAGCSIVSPGCTNCYAMRRVAPRLAANPATPHYAGTVKLAKGGARGGEAEGRTGTARYVWTGKIGIASDRVLTAPLRWTKPRRIFVNSTSDLFHEDVPDAVIDRVFAVMALSPQHTFQVLTKRAARMREYMTFARSRLGTETLGPYEHVYSAMGALGREGLTEPHPYRMTYPYGMPWPLPNVWLGVSAERRTEWLERTADLRETPAAIRFVSAEPLLGDLGEIDLAGLHWIIVGGESGDGARPMHPAWARSIRDQCAGAGVPFFFKQWGAWAPGECVSGPVKRSEEIATWWDGGSTGPHWQYGRRTPRESEETHVDDQPDLYRVGKKRAGRLLDGVEHNGFPEIREVPFG